MNKYFPHIPLQAQVWHFVIFAVMVGIALEIMPDIRQQSHDNAVNIQQLSERMKQPACVAIISPEYARLPNLPEKHVEMIAYAPLTHYTLLSMREDPEVAVIRAMDSIMYCK